MLGPEISCCIKSKNNTRIGTSFSSRKTFFFFFNCLGKYPSCAVTLDYEIPGTTW